MIQNLSKEVSDFIDSQKKSNLKDKINQANFDNFLNTIMCCVVLGYNDACRTFAGIKTEGNGPKVKEIIIKFIENRYKKEIISPISKQDWETLYQNIRSKTECVKFGGVQKIVNMAYKYMTCFYIEGKLPISTCFFNNCACPIDSYVTLLFLKSCLDINLQRGTNKNFDDAIDILLAIGDVKTDKNHTSKWSKLNLEEYIKVESCINDICQQRLNCDCGLEFDIKYWKSLNKTQQNELIKRIRSKY